MTDPSFRVDAPDGAWIFREGDVGDCAYVVESGAVAISACVNGEEIDIAKRGPGEIFGEMAIVDDQPRSASARATGDCRLLVVSRRQLKARTDSLDPVMKMLIGVLLERLRQTVPSMAARVAAGAPPQGADTIDRSVADFDPAIAHIALEQDLAKAIDREEVSMAYQPVVDAITTDIVGFEALMRWRSPKHGFVPPDKFIAAAESSGLIGRLTERAFWDALTMLSELRRGGFPSLFVNINVPGSEICRPSFAEEIVELASAFGVAPAQIGLELTETMLMDRPEESIPALERARALGFKVSIDDFGTGYSSLAYLSKYPVDCLKIDKAFVHAMEQSVRDEKVVRTMIDLGRMLDLRVIAEGVETETQAGRLRAFGCDRFQGYLFGKPVLSGEAIRRMMDEADASPEPLRKRTTRARYSADSAAQPTDKQASSAASVASS